MLHENLKILLLKSQEGDSLSYNQFLSETHKIILNFVLKRIKQNEIAEEITQEVLLGVHKNLHTFLEDSPVIPWIFGIARFKIYDYFRKNPTQYSFIEWNVTNYDQNSKYLMTQEIESLDFEKLDKIWNALPHSLSEPLVRTKLYGGSTREAASNLKIKENALRTRISRAIKILKAELENI